MSAPTTPPSTSMALGGASATGPVAAGEREENAPPRRSDPLVDVPPAPAPQPPLSATVPATAWQAAPTGAPQSDDAPQQVFAATDKGNVKVFRPPPDNAAPMNRIELPDSFFELSGNELKSLINTQTTKRVASENAGFKTSAVRAAEAAAKERRFPKTIIRVRFPDRVQLQGEFSSQARLSEVYGFVRGSLREPGRDFILYLTPPKKVLASMDETLYKASLSPASVVWFSWKSGVARQDGPYLADSWLKRMEDLPLALAPETQGQQRPEAQQDGNDVKCERVNPGGVTRSDVARGSKMTKWLKIGKK